MPCAGTLPVSSHPGCSCIWPRFSPDVWRILKIYPSPWPTWRSMDSVISEPTAIENLRPFQYHGEEGECLQTATASVVKGSLKFPLCFFVHNSICTPHFHLHSSCNLHNEHLQSLRSGFTLYHIYCRWPSAYHQKSFPGNFPKGCECETWDCQGRRKGEWKQISEISVIQTYVFRFHSRTKIFEFKKKGVLS